MKALRCLLEPPFIVYLNGLFQVPNVQFTVSDGLVTLTDLGDYELSGDDVVWAEKFDWDSLLPQREVLFGSINFAGPEHD